MPIFFKMATAYIADDFQARNTNWKPRHRTWKTTEEQVLPVFISCTSWLSIKNIFHVRVLQTSNGSDFTWEVWGNKSSQRGNPGSVILFPKSWPMATMPSTYDTPGSSVTNITHQQHQIFQQFILVENLVENNLLTIQIC